MRKFLVVVAFAAALWLFVLALRLHISFLRAESGLYLEASVLPWGEVKSFLRQFVFRSYGGHYTPIAFLLELLQSRLFQTHEAFWMARQMLVLGALAAFIASYVERLSGDMRLGLAIAAIFVVQPTVIELATWPFMALQIACLALTVAGAERLVNFVERNEDRDFGWFLGLSYATMHVFGVGAAISCGAIATGSLLMRQPARRTRGRVVMLGAAVAATAMHGYMMTRGAEPAAGPSVGIRVSILRLGALSIDSLHAALRALWGNGGFPWPNTGFLAAQGSYGLALVSTGLVALWRIRHRPIAFAATAFAFSCFVGYVLLVVYRLQWSPENSAMLPFLLGGRYFVFPAFFLLLGACAYLPTRGWPVFSVASAGAVIASATFFMTAASLVWPHVLLNNEELWQSAVTRARADLERSGVIRDESFKAADLEFASDLKLRRHLLERALGCTGCARFDDAGAPVH